MSVNSLHKFLREGNQVVSATLLSKQFSVPLSSTVRLMRDYSYTYTGEGWNPPPKFEDYPLLMKSETLNAIKETGHTEEELKEKLLEAVENNNYKRVVSIAFSLYATTNQPLPLVL